MVSRKAEPFSAHSEVPGVPQLGHTCLPPPAPRPAHAACPDLHPSNLHNSKRKTRIAFLPKPATKQTRCHFWRAGEREDLSETFLYYGKKSLSQALQQCPSAPIPVSHIRKLHPALNLGLRHLLVLAKRLHQEHREVGGVCTYKLAVNSED